MLRRQRGPEALVHRSAVLRPHQPQHFLPKLLVVSAIRCSPRAAVLQTRCPFLAIALPQPLRLPVTHAQELGRIHHPQLLALHPRQYPHPAQFLLAHPRPPQSDLLSEVLSRGHFYRGQKGTLSSRFNTQAAVPRPTPARENVFLSYFVRTNSFRGITPELRQSSKNRQCSIRWNGRTSDRNEQCPGVAATENESLRTKFKTGME